ncbi:hypothetical protein TrCOL_g10440 [Triparma columacea]|uniref:Uncharacterized protein n=1 Tax=Triparma columacea TaxID=722753 RepID=A0A9W7G9Z0_9STRA|nr:hypothetical protein TrCOL_g10440 [Triparma columacea]
MEFRNHYLTSNTAAVDDILDLNGSDSEAEFDIGDVSSSKPTTLVDQAKIVDFLRGVRGASSSSSSKSSKDGNNGGMKHTYSSLSSKLGISFTPSLLSRLSSNPRIVPFGPKLKFDKSTGFAEIGGTSDTGGLSYEPKFNVKDKQGILRLVQQRGASGILGSEIADCYPQAGKHLQDLVDEGSMGGISRKGEFGAAKKSIYPAVQAVVFPRNGNYLVSLGKGRIVMDNVEGLNVKFNKEDAIEEKIRRGEGVRVINDKGDALKGRVSSEVKMGVGRFEQPPKAVAPLSLSSNTDLRPRANYVRPLKGDCMPLAEGFVGEAEVEVFRYGCSKKVRNLWLETASLVPKEDPKLISQLVKYKIGLPSESRLARVKHAPKAEVGKKRKSYVEKKNRISTNTHLEGTEAGEQLKKAMKRAREQR